MPKPKPVEVMDRVEVRLPLSHAAAWRKAAHRSEMTLSEWIRRRCYGDVSAVVVADPEAK